MNRWLAQKAPVLALFAVIAVGLVIFYPADLDSKLVAAGLSFTALFAASFIPPLGKRKRQSLDQMREEANARAIAELPAVNRIDPTRPLLVVGPSSGRPPRVLAIVIREAVDDVAPIFLVPEYKVGRKFEMSTFSDFAQLREYLEEHELRVVPQSAFSDELGVKLFGKDWRED